MKENCTLALLLKSGRGASYFENIAPISGRYVYLDEFRPTIRLSNCLKEIFPSRESNLLSPHDINRIPLLTYFRTYNFGRKTFHELSAFVFGRTK